MIVACFAPDSPGLTPVNSGFACVLEKHLTIGQIKKLTIWSNTGVKQAIGRMWGEERVKVDWPDRIYLTD